MMAHERECAVCMNDFNTPKILPCGHLLCRQCVISWMDSKSDAGCPLCTCPIVEHQGNSSQSSADAADALPTDSVMEVIVESARLLVSNDLCTICDDVTAEYICMQCVEKMCPSCVKIHKKMVATRSHDVESVSTVTPERLAASRPALCADHGDKHADIFCADHNLVICTSCFSKKHNECLEVEHLDDEMKSTEKALRSLTKVLCKAEDNLKQEIGGLNARVQTADVTEQENMALVDKTCDRLHQMVDECRKKLKKLISDSISEFKNSLYDVRKELEKRLGKVTSHKHIVTRATTVRARPAQIHALHGLRYRVSDLDLSADLEAEPWVNPVPEIAKHCDDVVKVMNTELQSLTLQLTEAEKPVLVFHENCGTNIRLTNCRRTARMVHRDKHGNGVVVSRDPMAVNVLYEVGIDEINGLDGSTISVGVTGIPPTQLTVTTFPEDMNGSIIIRHSGLYFKGYIDKINVGSALKSIKVGSRVGVLVDSFNNLHLYVDGQDQGVAKQYVARPFFAVFELRTNVIQVTALPTSRMTQQKKTECDDNNVSATTTTPTQAMFLQISSTV